MHDLQLIIQDNWVYWTKQSRGADKAVQAPRLDGPARLPERSPADAAPFEALQEVIRSVFPDVLVAPGLMIARTDARHYARVSDHVYRFSPVRMGPEDLGRLHGTNERISVKGLGDSVRFYYHLIRRTA